MDSIGYSVRQHDNFEGRKPTRIRKVPYTRSADYSDAGGPDEKLDRNYFTDSDEDPYSSESELTESEYGDSEDESLCPLAAKYKIRASGRKIVPPKFERDGVDFMVDIDPEVEESLGRNFYDEHGASDNEDGPEDDYVPPARQLHLTTDASEKEYLEQALTMWQPRQRAYLRDLTRREGISTIISQYLVQWRIPIENLLLGYGVLLSKEDRQKSDKWLMQRLQAAVVRCMRSRDRSKFIQRNFKTEGHVLPTLYGLLKQSKKIVVLSGAGISVSCGIPDFRSKDGLYAQLSDSGQYHLDDPQQMFDINFFRNKPNVFYSFAHQIYPSNFEPSPCHQFIRNLEKDGKLLRNYTQNIDTLEMKAGIKNVIQCHGSFATASCINCRVKVPGDDIKDDLLKKVVPLCKACSAGKPKRRRNKKKRQSKVRNDGWESDSGGEQEYPKGIMKPDITFFGEKLCTSFDEAFYKDLAEMDLLLIMGTSLKVSPVSDMIMYVPQRVPIVVINKTPITHIESDMQLLGDADYIINDLAFAMGYYDVGLHLNFEEQIVKGLDESTRLAVRRRRALEERSSASMRNPPTFKTHLQNARLSEVQRTCLWHNASGGTKKKVVGCSGLVLYKGAVGGSYVKDVEAEEKLYDEERMRVKKRRMESRALKNKFKKEQEQRAMKHKKKLGNIANASESSQGPPKRMKLDVVISAVSAIAVEH